MERIIYVSSALLIAGIMVSTAQAVPVNDPVSVDTRINASDSISSMDKDIGVNLRDGEADGGDTLVRHDVNGSVDDRNPKPVDGGIAPHERANNPALPQ